MEICTNSAGMFFVDIWKKRCIFAKYFMALVGVITGDIVDSTKIEGDGRTKLLSVLRSLLSQTLGDGVVSSDIFRGDSFQVVVVNASLDSAI